MSLFKGVAEQNPARTVGDPMKVSVFIFLPVCANHHSKNGSH